MIEALNMAFIKELQDADPDLLSNLYPIFSESSKEKITELRSCFDKKDWVTMRKTSHALRSSSLNLGATALPEVLQRMEFFKEGDEVALEKDLKLAELELKRLKLELAKLIG